MLILLFFLFSYLLIWLISSSYYCSSRRYRSTVSYVMSFLRGLWNIKSFSLIFSILTFFLLVANVRGNIPLLPVPTMFYSFTLTIRLLFWVPMIYCTLLSQFTDFFAHLLPYGSPSALMLFLPLVELFSQIIRPLTLIIRLSTNLRAGHIMMYMFSYFTVLSLSLTPVLVVVLSLLFILELCISLLQGYIFVSLIYLYYSERL